LQFTKIENNDEIIIYHKETKMEGITQITNDQLEKIG